MEPRVPHLTSRLQGHTSTIFAEMTGLAVEHGAVNLGQGAPDFSGPEEITEVAVRAIRDGRNQYAPGHGVGALRHAIVAHQKRFRDLVLDPDHEVTVTAGATEAICASLLALCDTGDEVLTFAPYYDSYPAATAMAGAVLRSVPLRAPRHHFDAEELRRAVTPRTRVVLVNTPHNPTGRVFDRDELQAVADLCIEHDLIAVTDEVYEHLVFDDNEHVPLATLPGMRERTVTVSSGGKTFSLTGWKIGWACAPPDLTRAVRAAKYWMSFSNGTPLQFAIAHALELPDAYFEQYRRDYAHRRGVLLDALADHGLEAAPPEGTYFVTFDIRQLGADDGYALCRRMPAEFGVAAVPVQVFHDDPDEGRHWIRLAFCKSDESMAEGVARLAAVRDALTRGG